VYDFFSLKRCIIMTKKIMQILFFLVLGVTAQDIKKLSSQVPSLLPDDHIGVSDQKTLEFSRNVGDLYYSEIRKKGPELFEDILLFTGHEILWGEVGKIFFTSDTENVKRLRVILHYIEPKTKKSVPLIKLDLDSETFFNAEYQKKIVELEKDPSALMEFYETVIDGKWIDATSPVHGNEK